MCVLSLLCYTFSVLPWTEFHYCDCDIGLFQSIMLLHFLSHIRHGVDSLCKLAACLLVFILSHVCLLFICPHFTVNWYKYMNMYNTSFSCECNKPPYGLHLVTLMTLECWWLYTNNILYIWCAGIVSGRQITEWSYLSYTHWWCWWVVWFTPVIQPGENRAMAGEGGGGHT